MQIYSNRWYASYLTTYLERDVRNVLNVGNLRDFDRFLRAVAIRTGQVLSYSDLARDVGISINTAKKWVSVLQASGQIYLLEPYYKNITKRLVKSPKIYMCNTGLAAFLLGFYNWDAIYRNLMLGAFWDTYIVMEVVKHFYAMGKSVPLWFWRTSTGKEIDLLIEKGGRFIAIECKFTETPQNSSLKGIKAFIREYGKDAIIAGYIVSKKPSPFTVDETILAIPGRDLENYLY